MIRHNKHGKLIVEVYDPATQTKAYVKPREHGMAAPNTEREARVLERRALRAIGPRKAKP
jgi:hypothetical protein